MSKHGPSFACSGIWDISKRAQKRPEMTIRTAQRTRIGTLDLTYVREKSLVVSHVFEYMREPVLVAAFSGDEAEPVELFGGVEQERVRERVEAISLPQSARRQPRRVHEQVLVHEVFFEQKGDEGAILRLRSEIHRLHLPRSADGDRQIAPGMKFGRTVAQAEPHTTSEGGRARVVVEKTPRVVRKAASTAPNGGLAVCYSGADAYRAWPPRMRRCYIDHFHREPAEVDPLLSSFSEALGAQRAQGRCWILVRAGGRRSPAGRCARCLA